MRKSAIKSLARLLSCLSELTYGHFLFGFIHCLGKLVQEFLFG
jgi:hypothetical protein